MIYPMADQAELGYEELRAWLARPYTSEELLDDLLYLHLLLGPVELDITPDFEVRQALVSWTLDSEDEPTVPIVGTSVPFVLSCAVRRDLPITDGIAEDMVMVLMAHALDYGWENFPPPPTDDAQLDLKRALHDFITRFRTHQQVDNPLRIGEVDIKIQPTVLGITYYWISFGEDTVPGVVRGGPKDALAAAREAVRKHSTALGALL